MDGMQSRANKFCNWLRVKSILPFLRKNGLALVGITILIAIYLFLASRLRGWLIDDAGISFSYARNLALGYGLVSQPGFPPVEGFSNPAWVFLLSIFARAGLDIAEIVKPLSVVLTTISIAVLYLAFLRLTDSKFLALVALCGLITQPAFVIWSVSGLENPLLILLVVVLFYICLLSPTSALAILAGIVSGLTAITRPDGMLYIPLYAILNPKYFKQTLLASIAIWGSYFVFRLIYYSELVPNTYIMKAEGKLLSKYWFLTMWGRFKSILLGLFGPKYLAIATIAVLLVLLIFLSWKGRIGRKYLVIGVFLIISFGSYLFLPTDWMGEYRFASPFFPFLYLCITLMIADIFCLFIKRKNNSILAAGIFLLCWLGVLNFVSYAPRLGEFAENPTVSFYGAQASFYRFTRYSAILNLNHPAVLLPDVGGALYYYPDIRIYDLGGLVDATVARTLDRNQVEFYNYVFDVAKPDFIHVHGGWTYTARLEDDPRFRQDYIAIFEYIDQAMVSNYGEERYSGDFVRRSLLKTPDKMKLLQAVEP
jgi:hypothetical protein